MTDAPRGGGLRAAGASLLDQVLAETLDPGYARAARAREGRPAPSPARRTGRVRAVRGVGYMWGLDTLEKAGDVVGRALELGLLVITAGDHTLRLLPPLVMTDST